MYSINPIKHTILNDGSVILTTTKQVIGIALNSKLYSKTPTPKDITTPTTTLDYHNTLGK